MPKEMAYEAVLEAPSVNWPQILDDLRDAGCSGYRVAQRLAVEWSTVQSWRECKGDIRYGKGRALLRLHSEYCGAGMTFQRLTEAEIPA